jgi:hypothetical protein
MPAMASQPKMRRVRLGRTAWDRTSATMPAAISACVSAKKTWPSWKAWAESG